MLRLKNWKVLDIKYPNSLKEWATKVIYNTLSSFNTKSLIEEINIIYSVELLVEYTSSQIEKLTWIMYFIFWKFQTIKPLKIYPPESPEAFQIY